MRRQQVWVTQQNTNRRKLVGGGVLTWGAVLCCHLCIISAFKCLIQPHCTVLLYLRGLGRLRFHIRGEPVLLLSVKTRLVSGEQPYLQRCVRLGTTAVGSGLNTRWEQWNAKPGLESIRLVTYHYAYNFDMPQTTLTLTMFCTIYHFAWHTTLLTWLEVLPNRAWMFLNSCDGRNEALNHFEAMPWKRVLLL